MKFVEYKEGETDACIRFETPEEVLIPKPYTLNRNPKLYSLNSEPPRP